MVLMLPLPPLRMEILICHNSNSARQEQEEGMACVVINLNTEQNHDATKIV
jgi:hypothetical protein